MELLNQFVTYESAATALSRAMFLDGDNQTKEHLRSGTRLVRFARMGAASPICEWWMLFDRIMLEDRRVIPGFGNFLEESGCKVDVNGTFLPQGTLKLGCANHGSRMFLVQLNQPVYAFAGPTTPQRPDPCEPGMALRGGEFRVWIPGLTRDMVVPIATPRFFVTGREEMTSAASVAAEPVPAEGEALES